MYQPKRLRIGDPQGKLPPLRREERAPPTLAYLGLPLHKTRVLRRAARQKPAEPVADIPIADLAPPGDSLAGARRQNFNPHSYQNLAPHKIAAPRVSSAEFREIVAEPEQRASNAEFKPATPVNRHAPAPLLPSDCRR